MVPPEVCRPAGWLSRVWGSGQKAWRWKVPGVWRGSWRRGRVSCGLAVFLAVAGGFAVVGVGAWAVWVWVVAVEPVDVLESGGGAFVVGGLILGDQGAREVASSCMAGEQVGTGAVLALVRQGHLLGRT